VLTVLKKRDELEKGVKNYGKLRVGYLFYQGKLSRRQSYKRNTVKKRLNNLKNVDGKSF